MKSIFEKTTYSDFLELLEIIKMHVGDINELELKELFSIVFKYKNSVNSSNSELRLLYELEQKWYKSIEDGYPDYSIYSDYRYIIDTWVCWKIYSRKYLLTIGKTEVINSEIKNVIDLGCGFGYTCAGLKELFPSANIYGTNFEDSIQYKVCSSLGILRGFKMVPDIKSLPINFEADIVFASEYFEHIYSPVNHLEDIIIRTSPKYLIIASSFGAKSIGHFNNYVYKSELIPNKSIGRIFNNSLRELGYEQIKTGLWNNRPNYWRRK